MGRMTLRAREERKEVGQEEGENQLPSSVFNRAFARSRLVVQALQLTDKICKSGGSVI